MLRGVIQLVIIAISIMIFFMFTKVQNENKKNFSSAKSDLETALANYENYSRKKDAILAQKDAIDPADLTKLQKMLPRDVENMRLILDINQVAGTNKIVIRNIKFDAQAVYPKADGSEIVDSSPDSKYNKFDIQFSAEGRYSDFTAFMTQIEKNERVLDIKTVDFTTSDIDSVNVPSDYYKYQVQIQTYWLGSIQ